MFGEIVLESIDFQALFGASPNPYVLLDDRFDIVTMNDAYLRVTQRQREELVGRNMFDAFPSDPRSESHKQLRSSLERVLNEAVVDHIPLIHYDIPLPGGRGFEERYWSATHTPLPAKSGKVRYILQHTVDVTELHRLRLFARSAGFSAFPSQAGVEVLRRAEAVQDQNVSLAREKAHLEALFQQAPGFMALTSGPQHTYVMANEACLRLVGNREMLGKPMAQAFPEAAAQGFIDIIDRVYNTGEPFVGRHVRVELERGFGQPPEELFVDFIYQPFRDDAGEVCGIFIQGHDVTEQKRAEMALRESEERFRLVAESAPVMLWMGDQEARCVYLNRALREFWGVAMEDVPDFDWNATVHPEDVDVLTGPFLKAMEEQTPFTVEVRYRRVDGEYRVLRTDAHPRFGPDKEFLGMIGVNVDVSDIRRAEEQLRQLNETLEARVVSEIAERRQAEIALQKAQKMEAIGKLTGGVAHDFNNLLQVVSGNLQLLAKDIVGNDRAERRVANALAGVSRGAKLASQLLAFGRRQPLEPKVVNIGRFVTGMEEMLRRTIGEAIDIETIISGGLWNTFVDPNQIENALLNLAINARDAMDGRGRLTIEASNAFLDDEYARSHAEVTPGQYVMLAVTDTGCGMSPDVLDQVFEPFFSTKPEGQGSGLGLPMVYGFVKQSGGHIKIYSEVGQGTTVKVYLPRVMQNEDAMTPVELGAATGGTETILVAEDDEEVRATVVDMLKDLGYSVLTAKDGESALAILESGVPVDLLFTDVVMPGRVRSPELARRAEQLLPNIAVLFTSGYTENAIVHGGRLDEGVELLSKPYTRETLSRKIRHVLANQQQRNEVAMSPASKPRRAAAKQQVRSGKAGSEQLTILLVEDDQAIRSSTAELLQDLGHVVVEAASAEEATAALQTAPVDVLFTDLNLPGISGSQFAQQARALRPGIGIVFATGYDKAPKIREGSLDYLLRKPYDRDGIAAALAAVGAKLPQAARSSRSRADLAD